VVTVRTASLSRVGVGVVISVGDEREGEGIWARHVSREGVEPAHHPDTEREGFVNPVLRVVVFFFAGCRCAS